MEPEQPGEQGEPHSAKSTQAEQVKDQRAVALGQRGGQKRMAHLSAQERSALAKHAARARWYPLEVKARRERAEEIALIVKQAIDEHLPN
jgi:hypothetical protein